MTTIAFYNHTRKLFANGEVDLADCKVMLVNDHTFSATHTVIGSVTGDEVSGSGWDAGGEVLASAAITVVNTNESKLDATDISVTATGGSIGPATGAVIYDDDASTKNVLFYIDFEGTETAGEGTDFKITWHANGIARWLAPT